jgi:hypothetical protein
MGWVVEQDLGLKMKDMGMSLEDAPKEETPQNLTPKFVEELAKKNLSNNKTIENVSSNCNCEPEGFGS